MMVQAPFRTSRAIASGLLAGLLLAALVPAGQAQELKQTNPNHFSRGVGDTLVPLNSGQGVPDFRTVNPTPRNLKTGKRSLRDSGPPDRRLTEACRQGRFLQKIDQGYVVRLGGRTYGAGIGGRAMLYDPLRLAQSGVLYVFVGQGTTNCRVYMLGVPGAG